MKQVSMPNTADFLNTLYVNFIHSLKEMPECGFSLQCKAKRYVKKINLKDISQDVHNELSLFLITNNKLAQEVWGRVLLDFTQEHRIEINGELYLLEDAVNELSISDKFEVAKSCFIHLQIQNLAKLNFERSSNLNELTASDIKWNKALKN